VVIETTRMLLIPATLESLRTELERPGELAHVLRMEVSAEWPSELYDRDPIEFMIRRLETAPDEAPWWLYYFAVRGPDGSAAKAIGCGGYKGPPSETGVVEIGYSVVAQERRMGYATEAAEALVRNAFADDRVERVIAETLPDLIASIGVLEKCGFRFAGAGSEEGVIRYELARSDWRREPRSRTW
jgi:RimJ/RimL family protein N-acetyltransferase